MAVERIVPGTNEWKLFYANHICRYRFAKLHLLKFSSLKVLDIACGVGYGTNYLSKIENSRISGADISIEALKVANESFSAENINFYFDNCDTLNESKKSAPFDSIVSFETLEHLQNPALFLENCARVLKPQGQLIISTPNSSISSPDGIINWEFHEKEYKAVELYGILDKHGFENIKIFGQQYTSIGKLRMQFAGYINAINSNPFIRFGRWLQRVIRGRDVKYVVSEEEEDFEIVEYDHPSNIDKMAASGPFVIIAIAEKKGTS